MKKLELIGDLKKQADGLGFRDENQLDALRKRADMIIRNVFGPNASTLKTLEASRSTPVFIPRAKIPTCQPGNADIARY